MKPIDEANEMLQRARRKQAGYPAKYCGPIVALMATRWVEDLEELPRLLTAERDAALEEAAKVVENIANVSHLITDPHARERRRVLLLALSSIRALKGKP